MRPGDNPDISDAVLRTRRNKFFADKLVARGMLSTEEIGRHRPPEADEPAMPTTRYALAAAKPQEVTRLAHRLNLSASNVDDAREAIAAVLFEG